MKETVTPEILSVKDKLFKGTAYDIRAYVGEPGAFFGPGAVLTPESMRIAGVLMGSIPFKLRDGRTLQLRPGDAVVVGYDNGPTSKQLAAAFAGGLTQQGVDVYDIGIASSGQVYHNKSQLEAQGFVQITRSHVEVTTNGAKFGIHGQGIHTYLLAQMNDALSGPIGRDTAPALVYGKAEEGFRLYTEKMIIRYGDYFKEHKRKLAVNLFGGTGLKYKGLFQEIFGDGLIVLGDEVNVNEGTLLADPTRREMLERVPQLDAALDRGLRIHSFDLDADRGSLTEGKGALGLSVTGHYLGDDLAYIMADYKLTVMVPALMSALTWRNLPKEKADRIFEIASTVLVDPRYTSGVSSFVAKKGGSTVYHRKGHSLWKETMSAHMAELAALVGFESAIDFAAATGYQDMQIEASLHLFCTDPEDAVPRDDAIENVFILEQILDKLGITSLHDYFAKIPRRFATKEIRTNSASNELKEAITYKIIELLKQQFKGDGHTVVEFDGQLRVDWDSGFVMYGMSNTSPKLTFMAEGSTAEERNFVLAYILALHNKVKAEFGDETPMDTGENAFFVQDAAYGLAEPDKVTLDDSRAVEFMKRHGIFP